MNTHQNRWIPAIFLLLAAISCGGGEGTGGQGGAAGAGMPAMAVEIVTLEAKPLEQTTEFVGTVGLTGVLGDGEATADVVCTEPGIVYSMDRANLLGLVHGNPEIALTLLNYLALRVQEWGDLIQQLALPQPVEAPVVHPA